MSKFQEFFWVFLGGGVGSGLRWWVGDIGKRYWLPDFPIYTLLVNVLGCLLLTYLYAEINKNIPIHIKLLVGTGFCGGFTTFSTFSLEMQLLFQKGMYFLAIAYLLVSFFLGIFLCWWIFKGQG